MSRYYSDLIQTRSLTEEARNAQLTGYFDPYAHPSQPPFNPSHVPLLTPSSSANSFHISQANSARPNDGYQMPPLLPPGGGGGGMFSRPRQSYNNNYPVYPGPGYEQYPLYNPSPPPPGPRSGFFAATTQFSAQPRKRPNESTPGNNNKKKKGKTNNNKSPAKPLKNAPKAAAKPAAPAQNVVVKAQSLTKAFVKAGAGEVKNQEPLIKMEGTVSEVLEGTKIVGDARRKKFRFKCLLLYRVCGLKVKTTVSCEEAFRKGIPFTMRIFVSNFFPEQFQYTTEGLDLEVMANDCVLNLFQKMHDYGIWSKEMILNCIEKDNKYSKDLFQEAKLALLTFIQEVDRENLDEKIKDGTVIPSPEDIEKLNAAAQRASLRIAEKDYAPDNLEPKDDKGDVKEEKLSQ